MLVQRCYNAFGRIKFELRYRGVLDRVIPHVRQQFIRFALKRDAPLESVHELRLRMYQSKILPIFRESIGEKTIIFVSSYFDFLRLRSFYQKALNTNIFFVSEYTKRGEENRIRKQFGDQTNEQVMYLVMTERHYFYQRIRYMGAHRVVFYSLPMHKEYYVEILNWLDTTRRHEVYALYCKRLDNLALQRIVGIMRMARMLGHENQMQVFT